MASVSGVLQDNDGNDLYNYTFDNLVLDDNNVSVRTKLAQINSDLASIGSITTVGRGVLINADANTDINPISNLPLGTYLILWSPGYITSDLRAATFYFNISGGDTISGTYFKLNDGGLWVRPTVGLITMTQASNLISIRCDKTFACQANGKGLTAVRL